ncbi:MAG: hypothetical protein RL557_97 [archaeon]|jgi:DNA polymerase III alpha subunit
MPEPKKREIAYKLRIGDILRASQIYDQTPLGAEQKNPRLLHVELGNKKIIRINIIANSVDKYESQSESRFASITLDDGSGQIKARVFGDELEKFKEIMPGDTLLIIGLLRSFNQELYIMPEIVRRHDPKYLLVRKLELDKESPRALTSDQKKEIRALRDEIVLLIKDSEKYDGVDKEEIILKFKETRPDIISQELVKLLEEGIIYEPRPGRVRYLG